MNIELIRKLFSEATFDESRIKDGVYHPYIPLQFSDQPMQWSITDEQIEKFAKLIINECKKVIDPSDDLCSMAEDIHRGQCVRMISKHFGVV